MRLKSPVVRFLISFVAAILIGILTWGQMRKARQSAYQGPMTSVLIAKRNIQPGQNINESFVSSRMVPNIFVEPGAILKTEELSGVRSRIPLQKGEQITLSKIENEFSRLGLAWNIESGQTAFTVRMTPEGGVGGHVLPGDFVAVIVSDRKENQANTVLAHARVMAVNRQMWDPLSPPPSPSHDPVPNEALLVTLMVTKNQAVRLASAVNQGKLTLALLSNLDEPPTRAQ